MTSTTAMIGIMIGIKIKICGIKTKQAALTATKAGADFLGFNFVPTSKRLIAPSEAQDIISSLRAKRSNPSKLPVMVGVFQNQPTSEIKKVLSMVKLDLLQFH